MQRHVCIHKVSNSLAGNSKWFQGIRGPIDGGYSFLLSLKHACRKAAFDQLICGIQFREGKAPAIPFLVSG